MNFDKNMTNADLDAQTEIFIDLSKIKTYQKEARKRMNSINSKYVDGKLIDRDSSGRRLHEDINAL